MNNEKAYEKQLASQLEKLDAPANAESHWPAMKALLDRELPEGAASFRWVYLLLLFVFFSGATWYFWPRNANQDRGVIATGGNKSIEAGTSFSKEAVPDNASAASQRIALKPVPETKSVPESIHTSSLAAAPESKNDVKGTSSGLPEGKAEDAGDAVVSADKSGKAVKYTVRKSRNTTTAQQGYKYTSKKPVQPLPSLTDGTELLMNEAEEGPEPVSPLATDQSAVVIILPDMRFAEQISTTYGENLMRYRPYRSRFPEETPRTRALRNRVVGTGENKNFVFGLTLPLTVAISDQKTSAFNIGGGSSKLSDYLPSPHVQYHINDRSFLQTEIQFYSPQYVRPALLYQQTQPNTSGVGSNVYRTRSVYTEKLYYFNLPVSGYYSPFKNFYLGTGMQYSRLLSGIAHVQETTGPAVNPSGNTIVVNDYFSRFSRDTLSAALNNNEFRVLLDANYYWKKFTMGFRYNQALGNYISMQVNGFNPYYTDRNKSFLFYLRYNLWENQKPARPTMAAARPH